MLLMTIGHGTLEADVLAGLLLEADVAALVDVRSHPGSRRNPQFGAAELARWLPLAGVSYTLMRELGGRRRPRPDSPNTAIRNAAFRGYADYMSTPAFGRALDRLMEKAENERVSIMCAESLWWRCHRRLIADAAVLLHEAEVLHILHDGRMQEHVILAGARLDADGHIVYGPPSLS